MEIIDWGAIFHVRNLVIGVLVMLSSKEVSEIADCFDISLGPKVKRIMRITTFTFGACVAVLSAFIYIAFYVLKIDF